MTASPVTYRSFTKCYAKHLPTTAACFFFLSLHAGAQSPPPPPPPPTLAAPGNASGLATSAPPPVMTYDVVSIKVNQSAIGTSLRMTPDGSIKTGATLRNMIGTTYGNEWNLISGLPGWADTTKFDVQEKISPEDVDAYKKLTPEQRSRMEQFVLEDRFKLVAHLETREVPVYEMVVAKGGPKLHEAKQDDTYANGIKRPDGTPFGRGSAMFGNGKYVGQQVRIQGLTGVLQSATGRKVIDKTGLTGNYDINLTWTPDGVSRADNGADNSEASIFTVLQEQLGLKLQPAKGMVKALVVDHVEMPSEN